MMQQLVLFQMLQQHQQQHLLPSSDWSVTVSSLGSAPLKCLQKSAEF
jgi:hypothetical protein